MSNKCIVLKLKEKVNANNLERFGCLTFTMNRPVGDASNSRDLQINASASGDVVVKILSGTLYSDTSFTTAYPSEVKINAGTIKFFRLKDDGNDVVVSVSKYNLDAFIKTSRIITNINIEDWFSYCLDLQTLTLNYLQIFLTGKLENLIANMFDNGRRDSNLVFNTDFADGTSVTFNGTFVRKTYSVWSNSDVKVYSDAGHNTLIGTYDGTGWVF